MISFDDALKQVIVTNVEREGVFAWLAKVSNIWTDMVGWAIEDKLKHWTYRLKTLTGTSVKSWPIIRAKNIALDCRPILPIYIANDCE